MNNWSRGIGAIAAIVSIGAGLYLLSSESASAETTVFDLLMHGIGAYFIARGLWMFAEIARTSESREYAKRLMNSRPTGEQPAGEV